LNQPILVENWPRRESPANAFERIAQGPNASLRGITNGVGDPIRLYPLGLSAGLFSKVPNVGGVGVDPYSLYREELGRGLIKMNASQDPSMEILRSAHEHARKYVRSAFPNFRLDPDRIFINH
jgi:hypothetical protein